MKHIFLSLLIGLGAIALSGCGSTEAGVCPITGARGPRPTAMQTGDKAADKAECCKEKQSKKKPACCSAQPATSEGAVPAATEAVESTSALPACCKSAA